MLVGPPIEVSPSYGASPLPPLPSQATTPGSTSPSWSYEALPSPPLSSQASTPGSTLASPPDPQPPQHKQLCPSGLDTMSGIGFQVALPVPASPAASTTAHTSPAQQASCEDSDAATAGQTAVTGQPKSRHVRFDSLVESESPPQGVSLLDRSLTPPAHASMLPRHSLNSIQLDDALGMDDSSPAGTGKPKRKGTPRIKSRCSRSSKQRLPALLHTPLLPDAALQAAAHRSSIHQTRLGRSHSCSPDTAAAASTPLHRLKSALAAGWQLLCKAGRRVMAAGQKLTNKVLSALGVQTDEQAHSLLAEHQAEDIAAPAVQPQGQLGYRAVPGSLQPYRAFQAQPQGRLPCWRV